MKMIALVVLLATAGLVQVAQAQTPPPIPCPEGTYPTPVGLCLPEWEFD